MWRERLGRMCFITCVISLVLVPVPYPAWQLFCKYFLCWYQYEYLIISLPGMVRLYFLNFKFWNTAFTNCFWGWVYEKTVGKLNSVFDFLPSELSKLDEMLKMLLSQNSLFACGLLVKRWRTGFGVLIVSQWCRLEKSVVGILDSFCHVDSLKLWISIPGVSVKRNTYFQYRSKGN